VVGLPCSIESKENLNGYFKRKKNDVNNNILIIEQPLLLLASATKKTTYATDHITNLTQKTCREKATS
jgi:hypothetical protein